jgi:hypothetical protein
MQGPTNHVDPHAGCWKKVLAEDLSEFEEMQLDMTENECESTKETAEGIPLASQHMDNGQ